MWGGRAGQHSTETGASNQLSKYNQSTLWLQVGQTGCLKKQKEKADGFAAELQYAGNNPQQGLLGLAALHRGSEQCTRRGENMGPWVKELKSLHN